MSVGSPLWECGMGCMNLEPKSRSYEYIPSSAPLGVLREDPELMGVNGNNSLET